MKLKEKLTIGYIRAQLNILALVSADRAAEKVLTIFSTPLGRSGKKLPALFDRGEKLSFRQDGHTVRGHRWQPVSAAGQRSAVSAVGQGAAPRVLIVHGFQSSSRNFEQYIEGLQQKGYEVLAFDAPAHGQSGGKKITLMAYIAMLEYVLREYGPVQAYIGHSFGGLALSLLLDKHPPQPDTRLVLIAPATEAVRAVDDFFTLLRLGTGIREAFDALALRLTGRDWSWFSIRRVMQQLKIPVLWLHDEEDRTTPLEDALPVKVDGHPNIRFVITKGLGHQRIYRDESMMREVFDFL